MAELDAYVGKLPTEGQFVVAASYKQHADEQRREVRRMAEQRLSRPQGARGRPLRSVFGCRDHNWAATFQRIPRLIDAKLEEHGAERIYRLGEGDQATPTSIPIASSRLGYGHLFEALAGSRSTSAGGRSRRSGKRASLRGRHPRRRGGEVRWSTNSAPGRSPSSRRPRNCRGRMDPSRRRDPPVMSSFACRPGYLIEGDHLGVLPRNSIAQVRRVLTYFGLPENAQTRIRFNSVGKSFLPVGRIMPITLLLSGYLALQDVATRSDVEVLADYAESLRPTRRRWRRCAARTPTARRGLERGILRDAR
ncbi:MAG: flavodoxin domain-containing protein [Xanthobacteraceae bacterium]